MLWRKKYKILMVEDQLNNHPLYRDAFGGVGFEVVVCQTAEGDFVDEVVEHKPDLITMDLMLAKPGEVTERDGFDALALLKEDTRTQDIPVVVLTNFFQDEKVERAKSLGAVDFFNHQGLSLPHIAERCLELVKHPRRYHPQHPEFRS